MTKAQNKTILEASEELESTQVKRTGRFLFFFKTEWWETVSTRHIGNDIHILTERPIRQIYINGKAQLSHPHE